MKTPFNPSRRATARVKNPLPTPTVCNCCGGDVKCVKNSVIYNGRDYGEWPWVYLCDSCGAYVGLHPYTSIPLGTLADCKTRAARSRGKDPFMMIYKRGLMTRSEAYSFLAEELHIEVSVCHFGWFDEGTAIRAGEISRRKLLSA